MGRGYGISGNVGSYMHVEKKPKLTPDEKDERLRNKKKNKYEQQREKMLKENRDNSFGRPKDNSILGKPKPEAKKEMYLRGMRVVHVTFGVGKIIDVRQDSIYVKFDNIDYNFKCFDKKTLIQRKLLLPYGEAIHKVNLRKE